MKKTIYHLFLVLLLVVGMQGSGYAQKLVILHTNDTHSQITPQVAGKAAGLAGYERREAYINRVREENPNVILIDAGDFWQGTPYFTIFKGQTEIELMNALRYDAVCLGNHEFDNGTAELAKQIRNARFDVVCANMDFTGTPMEGLVKPYTILERGGKRIGIIGEITNLNGLVNMKNIKGVKWLHPVAIINRLALQLKTLEKCDLVILLSHAGYDRGTEQNPTDDILAKQSENIDIIVGGHSHTYIEDMAVYKNRLGKDVIVVTAHEKGNFVGRLDIEF